MGTANWIWILAKARNSRTGLLCLPEVGVEGGRYGRHNKYTRGHHWPDGGLRKRRGDFHTFPLLRPPKASGDMRSGSEVSQSDFARYTNTGPHTLWPPPLPSLPRPAVCARAHTQWPLAGRSEQCGNRRSDPCPSPLHARPAALQLTRLHSPAHLPSCTPASRGRGRKWGMGWDWEWRETGNSW